MARYLIGPEGHVFATPDFQMYARILVEGATLNDLFGMGNPLRAFTITADIDQPVQSATVTLDLGAGATSLSPYWSTGASIGGVPVFAKNRAIKIQVRCVLAGTPPSDVDGWRAVFDGVVDAADVAPNDTTITLRCRDRFAALQIAQVENISPNVDAVNQWGFPMPAGLLDAQMQYLLGTAWLYANGVAAPFAIVTVGTVTDSATAYWQERMSIMDALRALGVGKNGWDLRGKWDLAEPDSFELAYYEPGRGGVNSTSHFFRHTHDGVNIRYLSIQSLTFDTVGVRNVAEVTPADAARVPVVTLNYPSVDLFGRRFLAASEDAASHIDTPAEAAALGAIIVNDLGTGQTAISLECPFTYEVEINDLFVVASDGRTFDTTALTFAVTHLEMKYALGSGSLTVNGRESSAGASQLAPWRRQDQQYVPKKVYVALTPPVGPAVEGALWIPVTSLDLPA